MTPWLGLMLLAKVKFWVGILAVSKTCLAHSGDMRQGSRNALLKLGMWRLRGLAEKGNGGRELVLMVEKRTDCSEGHVNTPWLRDCRC